MPQIVLDVAGGVDHSSLLEVEEHAAYRARTDNRQRSLPDLLISDARLLQAIDRAPDESRNEEGKDNRDQFTQRAQY